MKKIVDALVTGMIIATSLSMIVIIGPLFGGIAAAIAGLFFGETILGIFGQIGIHDITMFQAGVFLGFVGSFLKTPATLTK